MKSLLTLSLFILFTINGFAQASMSTNSITQAFSIGTNSEASLPRNWRLAKSSSVRTVNTYPTSPVKADTVTQFRGGSLMAANSPAGIYNLGAGDSILATNRAIGFLANSTDVKSCNLYFHIKNTGPTAITSFNVDYFVRKFKNGSNIQGFQMQMYYSRDGVTWTDAGSDFLIGTSADGNDNGFTIVSSAGLLQSTGLVTETILPNQQFYFAWNYSVSSGTNTANAPVYGIDGITISPNVALPISLVKFTANKLAEKVKVQWTTASEINNDKFLVERSVDGENFDYIAQISGAGFSKELTSYEVIDPMPLKGTSYYRLTQIDFNGSSETFSPVAVSGEQGALSLEQAAGSTEQGVWSIYSPMNTEATLSVTDLNGKIIYTEKLFLKEGYQNHQVDLLAKERGIYVVRLITAKNAVTKKLLFDKE